MVAYAIALALVVGSVWSLTRGLGRGFRSTVAGNDPRFAGLTVDSVLLADLLDRGIKGIRLLAARQQQAVEDYVDDGVAQSRPGSSPSGPRPGGARP